MKISTSIHFIIDCGDIEDTEFKAEQIFIKMLTEFLDKSFDTEIVKGNETILILNDKKDVQGDSK